ncbi:penicillin-binding protein [Bacillus sp. T33-2]|uniref:penicillin-binding protein n=1 Tax=Bacillus sp. T33-2 TaxID=2054168 RepID=UPI000C776F4A|nr:penicillin-binding protein [Bacillus sp. T33-2]PLR97383.1 penicillin-binding protein [Bacillus sp. T33-2]
MAKKQPNMNAGAAILFLIFSLLFFILIFRFVTIQVTGEAHGQALAARAQKLHSDQKVIESKRGTIFDRKGEVIAEDTAAFTLVAILDKKMTTNPKKPRHVTDPEYTAGKLAQYIDMPESEIYSRLTKKGPFQVEFGKAGRDISQQTKQKIEKLKLPGITFIRDSKRFYPNGVFSSHLIGFVEKEEEEDYKNVTTVTEGTLGIEKSLNSSLTGKDGSVKFETDLWGFLLPDSKKDIIPAQNGDNVYLTLDKKIQIFLEDAISEVDKQYKPKKIFAVVADPKTGDILAMGQRPTFHPQTREGLEKTWHNEIIETSLEPGSTMKVFTLAAAVQEKKFNPNDTFQSGSYEVTPKAPPIKDHNNGRGWGPITYLEGIQRSSNVAVSKLVQEQIGVDKYREYLTRFGFEQPTGIDLPEEVTGKILYDWPVEKITTSFGQGTTLTPIQLVQAATAIANDGKMMRPRIIDQIVDSDTGDIIKKSEPEVAGEPISAETAKEVRDILETVVTAEHGTGHNYQIDGYQVAGKTGTAQIPGPDGKYMTGHKNFLFSFLGMAPKDDPKLVIYVAVQQPEIQEDTNGSVPVSMIFNKVMKSSLQYLNIQPAAQEKASADHVPDISGMTVEEAGGVLESKGFNPVIFGSGANIEKQVPKAGSLALEGEKVILKTNGDLAVPDMNGWSLRDVMKLAQSAGLKLNKSGSGYVVKQSLNPGAPVKAGDFLIVDLETPEQQFIKATQKPAAEDAADGTEETAGG